MAGLVVLLCVLVGSARVEVASAALIVTQEVRVAAGSDDAEERAGGSVSLTSTDLELVFDGSNQIVGIRFNGVAIPQAAQILNADVQFKVDEVNTEATSLTIQGQAADNAATFASSSRNISSRQRTTASAGWSPATWTTVNQVGPDQRTPSLASVVQEIVNRPGWASGNSLALIVTGTGHRTARAHNGEPGGSPLLHVEYQSSLGNTAPTVTITEPMDSTTFTPGNAITFNGTAADAQDADLTSSLAWTSSLDGAIGTGGTFGVSNLSVGVHTITARVADSDGLAASASVLINVVENTNVLIGAGDIASCGSAGDEATANLLDTHPGSVFTLGDNVYPNGTAAEFASCYQPTWGRHKARTRPVPGNHDYNTPGATGYYGYFGAAAGDPTKGYYSYDLSSWHIVVLNSEIDASVGSSQERWLRDDLTANPAACTVAMFHKPRFSSGTVHGSNTLMAPLWDALHDHGADIVLNGHEHNYERFGLQSSDGIADPVHGIRQFVVGTGGISQTSYLFGIPLPNSEVRHNNTRGLLALTLLPTSYAWEFIPEAGMTFSDTGSGNCVQPVTAPPTGGDTGPPSVSLSAPSDGVTVRGTVTISAVAGDDAAVDHVEFMVGGVVVGSDTTDPYSVNWASGGVVDGAVTLSARAVDTSAKSTVSLGRSVIVDNTPPETSITAGPSGSVASGSASFDFASTEPGSSFQCRRDGAAFAPCSSPVSYTGLADGSHTFEVGAADAVGNVDPSPASRSWSVVTPPSSGGIRREAVSTMVNATATGVVTVAKPSGTVAGDVLVTCLALNGGSVSSTGVPVGWTPIAAVTAISNPHVFGYYRVAGGLEPAGYSWTLAGSVANGAGIARYSGVSNASPLGAAVSVATGASGTSGVVAGVTTGAANAMLVGCVAINSSNTAITVASPVGMAQAWDVGGKRHEFADGVQSAAGASGSKSWTFSAGREWAGWLTALRPQ